MFERIGLQWSRTYHYITLSGNSCMGQPEPAIEIARTWHQIKKSWLLVTDFRVGTLTEPCASVCNPDTSVRVKCANQVVQ